MWQDWALAGLSLAFLVPMVASLRSIHKPHLLHSLGAAVLLTAYAGVMWTLGMRLAVLTEVVGVAAWLVLAWQGRGQR